MMTVPVRLVSVKSQHSNAFRWYAAKFGVIGSTSRQNIDWLLKRLPEDDICWKWRKISSASKRGNATVDDPPCQAFDRVEHVEQRRRRKTIKSGRRSRHGFELTPKDHAQSGRI
jgi:hypothetical protein